MKPTRLQRATQLHEVHRSCQPRPLRRDELDEFFVSTADARDETISRRERIRKFLTRYPDGQSKILLAGHAGSGKSTELVKLIQELDGRFFVVAFSVLQECNLVSLAIEDLLVVMMERLVHACQDAQIELEDSKALEEIYAWFARETDVSHTRTEHGTELEAGVDTSASYLGKLVGLLGKWKNSIRHKSVHYRTTEISKPQRLSELAERCNSLIGDVQIALEANKQPPLLILIEDADKMNLGDARRIFIEQPRVLADLTANIICTIPIFLLHSPERSETLDPLFQRLVLPMPKVYEFDGSPCTQGRDTLRQIIEKRMEISLIEEDALDLLIEKTGGVLRDILEVLMVAAEVAESMYERQRQPEACITEQNVRYGLNRRKTEYARSISTVNLPSDWQLTNEDLYARLRELAKQPHRVLPTDPCAMVLLQSKAVIEYNGEQWFDVHPLVKEILSLM